MTARYDKFLSEKSEADLPSGLVMLPEPNSALKPFQQAIICCRFTAWVYSTTGRTVFVHPLTQIFEPMLSCVTVGLTAPGVIAGSGSVLTV